MSSGNREKENLGSCLFRNLNLRQRINDEICRDGAVVVLQKSLAEVPGSKRIKEQLVQYYDLPGTLETFVFYVAQHAYIGTPFETWLVASAFGQDSVRNFFDVHTAGEDDDEVMERLGAAAYAIGESAFQTRNRKTTSSVAELCSDFLYTDPFYPVLCAVKKIAFNIPGALPHVVDTLRNYSGSHPDSIETAANFLNPFEKGRAKESTCSIMAESLGQNSVLDVATKMPQNFYGLACFARYNLDPAVVDKKAKKILADID